jgi:hypothetical protein
MKRFAVLLCVGLLLFTLLPIVYVKGEPQGGCYALLIGVSDYAPAGPGGMDLSYADDDADDWYSVLTVAHGWLPSNIVKLTDSQATKANIQAAFTRFAEVAEPRDLFLFFFAGHGGYVLDQPPYDEVDGYDEYILTHDLQMLVDDELAAWLSRLNVGVVVAVFDSCFSGGFMKGLTQPLRSDLAIRTLPELEHKELEDTVNGDLAKQGYVVLTACDDDELCVESSRLQNGVFTYYLIEGMNQPPFPSDTDGDHKVSAEEAYAYANPRATLFYPGQHAQLWDGVPSEAELTVLKPQAVEVRVHNPVGGVLKHPSKAMILTPYLAAALLAGSTAITLRERRRRGKVQKEEGPLQLDSQV